MVWASAQADWAIGFLDEVWWSRFALPRLYAWQDQSHPVRLVEPSWQKGDPDPKALACYGVLWQEGTAEEPQRDQMWLRFVTGRPESRDHERVAGLVLPVSARARQTQLALDLG